MSENERHYAPVLASLPSMDLLVTSNMASSYLTTKHDPANFTIQLPNNAVTSKVVKCVPKLITVPRLFDNITDGNNEVTIVVRGQPNTQYRQVVPSGLYTTTRFVETLNIGLPVNLQFVVDSSRLIRMVPAFYADAGLVASTVVFVPPGSEFARYMGWENLTSTPTPLYVCAPPSDITGLTLPQLGGPQCINVTLRCAGPQQINAKDGCDIDCLAMVDLACPIGETAVFRSQDTFVNDIDHMSQPRNYSTLEIHVLDAWTNRPLKLPNVCTVSVLLKLYHVDTQRE